MHRLYKCVLLEIRSILKSIDENDAKNLKLQLPIFDVGESGCEISWKKKFSTANYRNEK